MNATTRDVLTRVRIRREDELNSQKKSRDQYAKMMRAAEINVAKLENEIAELTEALESE